MFKVLYHHAKLVQARISPSAWPAKNIEFFVCVGLSLYDLAIKLSEYRNGFDTV